MLPEPQWSLLRYAPTRGSVLDAGCGDLYYTSILKNSNPNLEITAVDIVLPDITNAKKNNFVRSCIENLPFKDESLDYIFCFSVLQYIKDNEEAIKEFCRVLKWKGRLLITLPTSKSVFRLIRDMEIRTRVYKWHEHDVSHYHYYTKNDIKKLVEDRFKILDLHGYNFNFIPMLLPLLFSPPKLKARAEENKVKRLRISDSRMMKKAFNLLKCIQNMRGPINNLCYHYVMILEKN